MCYTKKLLVLLYFVFCNTQTFSQDKWEYLPNVGLPAISGRYIDVFFMNYKVGITLYGSGKIFKTKDGGDNWYQVLDAPTSGFRSLEFLNDGKTGIAGTLSSKVWRTDDAGETWKDISISVPDTSVDIPKAICGLSHFGNNFYGVGWFDSKVAHFYRSKDKGLTWQTTYLDTNLVAGLVDVVFVSEDTGFVGGSKD